MNLSQVGEHKWLSAQNVLQKWVLQSPNIAREHNGLCVACHVKSLVKEKVAAANKPYRPTNVKSIDNLFNKFEEMLVTSETSGNLRIRRRLGIVHGEGLFVVQSPSVFKRLLSCNIS